MGLEKRGGLRKNIGLRDVIRNRHMRSTEVQSTAQVPTKIYL